MFIVRTSWPLYHHLKWEKGSSRPLTKKFLDTREIGFLDKELLHSNQRDLNPCLYVLKFYLTSSLLFILVKRRKRRTIRKSIVVVSCNWYGWFRYDQTLFEDETKNRMMETKELFDWVLKQKCFEVPFSILPCHDFISYYPLKFPN